MKLRDTDESHYDNNNWVEGRKSIQKESKTALATFFWNEYVKGNNNMTLHVGPGSTPLRVVEYAFAAQFEEMKTLNLQILTNSLEIENMAYCWKRREGGIFNNTPVVSTGGERHTSLNAYIGDDTVERILDPRNTPHVVVMGAFGINFDAGNINLLFNFRLEVPVQEALATRETSHRVIVIDESKFETKSFCHANNVDVYSLLAKTDRCTILCTMPEDPQPGFWAQVNQFEGLLTKLIENEKREVDFADKNLELILIDRKTRKAVHAYSLYQHRQQNKYSRQAGTEADAQDDLECEDSTYPLEYLPDSDHTQPISPGADDSPDTYRIVYE